VTIAIVVAFIVGMVAWKHQMTKKGVKPPIVRLLEKHRALKLPDKPSIAVLPFTNMSGDREQDYFSDGMTEDLITDLSKISGLFVISRNSVFTYKGRAVKIEEVAKDLGVRYVLEGSVRRVSDQVRITAQLIDATTGHHVWAERYDRDIKDIFALQDEVAGKIVEALAVNLVADEHARLTKKGTDNLGAYDLVLQGFAHFRHHTKESNELAREMFTQAVQLDPNYTDAYAGLVWTRMMAWIYGWSHDPKLLDDALELGKKAVSLDESSPKGHVILGDVYLWKKRHKEAIAELEKAVSLNPNDADALSSLGGALVFSGMPEKALGYLEKAIRLNPNYPEYYIFNLGQAFFQLKMYEEAVTALQKSILQNPNFMPAHYVLAACYGHLGKQELARAKAEDVKRMIPGFSAKGSSETLPFKDEEDFEHFAEGLRKAGLH
jgi:adenylate cyclase